MCLLRSEHSGKQLLMGHCQIENGRKRVSETLAVISIGHGVCGLQGQAWAAILDAVQGTLTNLQIEFTVPSSINPD